MTSHRRVVVAFVATSLIAAAATTHGIEAAATSAARYLVTRQVPSGAFFAPDARADTVAEVVAALVAGGVVGAPVERALAYVRANGPAAATKPAYAGRIVMGIVAGGGNPRAFGGIDYVARIRPDEQGSYDATLYGHALAALGVLAARGAVPAGAIDHIRDHQCPDGGYAYEAGCASPGNLSNVLRSNVDTTALALCVLAGARVPAADPARSNARAFLAGARNGDGGFGEYKDSETNANSTGLVLSAIACEGSSPRTAPWKDGGRDPVAALVSLQAPSGGFRFRTGDDRVNDYATVQALPGLAGAGYPVRPRPRTTAAGTGRVSSPAASMQASVLATASGAPGATAAATPATSLARERPDTGRAAAAGPASAGRGRGGGGAAGAATIALLASAAAWLGGRRWIASRAR